MAELTKKLSPWDDPEFKARVVELIDQGNSENVAMHLAADEIYPTVWVPPTTARQ